MPLMILRTLTFLFFCLTAPLISHGQNERRLYENKILDEMDNNLKASKKIGTFVVNGITEKDLSSFPIYIIDQITIQPLVEKHKDEKILVQFWSLYGYDSPLKGIMTCSIEIEFEKKHEAYFPDKEVVLPLITKQIAERMNKLLELKRQPLSRTINKLREEINRETERITVLRQQHEALFRKSGGYSPQAAEELRSKLWTQAIDLGSQIEGNQTMVAGLQKEIERLMKVQNNHRENGENSAKLENLKRTLREYTIAIENAKKAPSDEKSLAEEASKLSKQKESVERQITELEEKALQRKLPIELIEMNGKLTILREKLSEARNAYKNPRHPSILNLEQQVFALEQEGEKLKSRLRSATQMETLNNDDVSTLPALQAKLSETRIATDVLQVKRERISKVLEDVSSMFDGRTDLENKGNDIKQHQRALDLLNEKLLDARMKIELVSQSFELVPLK